MKLFIPMIGAVAMVILVTLISIHTSEKRMQRIIYICLFISVIAGLLFYGLGLSRPEDTPAETVINIFRTIEYTMSMYAGSERYNVLMSASDWFAASPFLQIVYWIVHMLAVFVTAGALLITWGKRLLKRLRMMIPRREICILYCNTDERYRLLEELEEVPCHTILTGDIYEGAVSLLADYSCTFVPTDEFKADGKWLRRALFPNKLNKKIRVVCLADRDENAHRFLKNLFASFKAKGIPSQQIKTTILADNPTRYSFLADISDINGNKYITEVYTPSELTARQLMHRDMPYKTMSFNTETCRAEENFRAIVIGCGSVGQDLLRYLVRYGQFLGSEFEADVIDSAGSKTCGLFREMYSGMIERFNIRFHTFDALSDKMYDLFDANRKIHYLAVCAGSEKMNTEILRTLRTFRQLHPEYFAEKSIMASCTREHIETIYSDESSAVLRPLAVRTLMNDYFDAAARYVNEVEYRAKVEKSSNEKLTVRDYMNQWYRKDPMDRLSAIAAAEFLPTFVACSGTENMTRAEAENEINTRLIRILPELEHLRWNAFESSMGVVQMPKEEFEKRIANTSVLIDKAVESGTKDDLGAAMKAFSRTRKDLGPYGLGGMHACLADWEDLDELWNMYLPLVLKYNTLMAKHELKLVRLNDFKELDEKNVYHMLDVLNKR